VGALVIDELRRAYEGRRVFVTGDTGFKGSWLCIALTELGAHVTGYALPSVQERDQFRAARLDRLVAHNDGDVRDVEHLGRVFSTSSPEIVFHLAAQSIVRSSYADPKTTFDTNVGGTVNILDVVRCSPEVRALVVVTSDKCYRNNEWIWGYRENDILGGNDPYSASKAAAELAFTAYATSFFHHPQLGAATVRAGNVIGGGDWSPHRIVPDCIRSLEAGQPIVLRNPRSTRPWQHVLEPVSGYLLLGARLLQEPERHTGAWNFGPRPERARTVRELAEEIVALWGDGRITVATNPEAAHEAGLLQLNCDKARIQLGWEATWDFSTAARETGTWYRRFASGDSALELTREQFHRYFDTAR
jgi:CDP-glucose 4,6-dehydratase